MDREFVRRHGWLWFSAAMLGMNSGGFAGYLLTGGNILFPIWFSMWMFVWLAIMEDEAGRLDGR